MASPTDIRKGRVIVYQGTPHLVLEMLHRTRKTSRVCPDHLAKPQSGPLQRPISFHGQCRIYAYHNAETEYSYKDTEGHHFMDLETYEDTILADNIIGEDELFLVEGNSYDILLVDGEACD